MQASGLRRFCGVGKLDAINNRWGVVSDFLTPVLWLRPMTSSSRLGAHPPA